MEILDTMDYQIASNVLYTFIDYSILTNYYTMKGHLNPIVRKLLDDPRHHVMMSEIKQRHGSNLQLYK